MAFSVSLLSCRKIGNFPRKAIPADLVANRPIPSQWPHQYLKTSWAYPTCPTDQYFNDMSIILDITLCGDWAGDNGVYPTSGCPGTCLQRVWKGENFKGKYRVFPSVCKQLVTAVESMFRCCLGGQLCQDIPVGLDLLSYLWSAILSMYLWSPILCYVSSHSVR